MSIILTPGDLRREVEIIGNEGRFFFDVETVPSAPGMDDRGVPSRNTIMWMGLATKGRACKIPMGHPIGTKVIDYTLDPRVGKDGKTRNFKVPVYERPPEQMTREEVFDILNPLFADPDIEKAAHGATFDAAAVAKYRGGFIPAGKVRCTIEMKHLTDENRLRYGLKWVIKDDYGTEYDDKNAGKEIEKVPFLKAARYLHYDLKYGWLEFEKLRPLIIADGLEELWEMETELTSVLAEMRLTGVPMDVPALDRLRVEMADLVDQRERAVYAALGKKINLNSPVQKQTVLFKPKSEGGQGINPWKLTDGGKKRKEAGQVPDHTFWSTDDEALESFHDNPVVKAILEYQEANKVYGTYVIGYLGDQEKDKPCRVFDGWVYPDFVQFAAATGRFGCHDPNLQNVPAPRTELGRMVRALFVAPPGYKFVVADYGQIELVLLAHFIGYGAFYDGFLRGIDPHTLTAAMALNQDPVWLQACVEAGDKDAKNARQVFGKSINFATVYGAGIGKLASMMSVSFEQAKGFKKTYDRNTPEVGEYRSEVLREARKHSKKKTGFPPHTRTLMGRMRRVPELMSADDKRRMYAERQVFNAKIQGSSADLTKYAMVRFRRKARELGKDWKLVLTVHDEIVILVREEEAEEARQWLVWAMTGEGIGELVSLPMKVDVHVVSCWANAKLCGICEIIRCMNDKKCIKCGKKKSVSEFGKHPRTRDRLQSYCKFCNAGRCKFYRDKIKEQVFDMLGRVCVCCGEDNTIFLTLDHRNNDGAEHRRELNSSGNPRQTSGDRVWRWLVKNPDQIDRLQMLCYNCNCGKKDNGGVCPHKDAK
jgi:DNA polymerase I-like protein with 3'-5' exonuclease and polymerase domains